MYNIKYAMEKRQLLQKILDQCNESSKNSGVRIIIWDGQEVRGIYCDASESAVEINTSTPADSILLPLVNKLIKTKNSFVTVTKQGDAICYLRWTIKLTLSSVHYYYVNNENVPGIDLFFDKVKEAIAQEQQRPFQLLASSFEESIELDTLATQRFNELRVHVEKTMSNE